VRRVTDPLLTIGAFARAVGLSASALRYYDECGLLTPAEVDDTTGYRYYTPALSQQARLVAQLRELGVPIPVMKQVLTGSPEQGRAVLRELVTAQLATTQRVSSIVGQVLAELDRTPDLRVRPVPWCRARSWPRRCVRSVRRGRRERAPRWDAW